MSLQIKTNNHERQFAYSYEVPNKVLQDQFDWMDDPTEHSFFNYKGYWYCLEDFMNVDSNSPFPEFWHGYVSDSFFSGVVIHICEDADYFIVGTYYG